MAAQKNILLIDDDPQLLKIYKRILKPRRSLFSETSTSEGANFQNQEFQLFCASQGMEALSLISSLEETPIQVAFIDMNMPPGWDGIETCKHLLELDPRIKIILVSGFLQPEHQEELDILPVQIQTLSKPFPLQKVKQLASDLCQLWNQEFGN